ncbi:UDP-glucose 4-epimerase GalE, partial [Patescibacteria group bacterium]|nr:UDP-glucose 4-epimerase GalE [Patescibacteria group bacterium]
ILVTGGAGFIGSHVTKQLLDRDYSVIVYDDLSRGLKKLVDSRANFIQGSLSEKEKLTNALDKVEAVIHMAAFIVVPESIQKPKLYWENNVVGTQILLEAMREASVKKIVFSSSATVYGNPDKLPITEEAPVKKAENPYGQTKIEMEDLIKKEHEENHLSVVILRYFNPYGPNELHYPETHAIPNLIRATLAHKPIPLYWKGEQVRDFIYVEDLAAAHVEPLYLDGFHIFNVGTGEGTKVREVADKIFDAVGYKVPVQDLGERSGDVPELYTSGDKIKKELSWKANVPLEEGLERTVKFFKMLA